MCNQNSWLQDNDCGWVWQRTRGGSLYIRSLAQGQTRKPLAHDPLSPSPSISLPRAPLHSFSAGLRSTRVHDEEGGSFMNDRPGFCAPSRLFPPPFFEPFACYPPKTGAATISNKTHQARHRRCSCILVIGVDWGAVVSYPPISTFPPPCVLLAISFRLFLVPLRGRRVVPSPCPTLLSLSNL